MKKGFKKFLTVSGIVLLSIITLGAVVGATNKATGWADKLIERTEEHIDVKYKEAYFKADYLGTESTVYTKDLKYGRFTFTALENESISLDSHGSSYENFDETSGKMALHIPGEGSYTYGSIKFKTHGVTKLRVLVDNCADLYLVGPDKAYTEFYRDFYAYRNVDAIDEPTLIEFNIDEANEFTLVSLDEFDLLNIEIID